MTRYEIPVTVQVKVYHEIEAESIREANEIAIAELLVLCNEWLDREEIHDYNHLSVVKEDVYEVEDETGEY